MSYNGSGTFNINTAGQPVVTGTVISSTAFNALTADLATGLSTAITKDGQTTTTSRILFAQGISSTLTTDATSSTTGSIITAGGISCQKALNVGTTLASAAHTITATSANSLAVGANGTTNPVLNVDASTASAATGLNVKGAAAASGLAVSVTSSGTNENLTIDAKGSGTITFGGTSTGSIGVGAAPTNAKLEVVSGAPNAVLRNTSSTGYTSLRLYNDQNSSVRSLEIDYSGSAYVGALISGGPTGESAAISATGSYPLVFGTANTFRGMFDSSGNLLVNTTTTGGTGGDAKFASQVSSGFAASFYNSGTAKGAIQVRVDNTATQLIRFNYNGTGAGVGNITTDGTNTAYNTSSDARLKENISDAGDAGSIIDALKVRQWDWKSNGKHQAFGFVAQEEALAYPDAVTVGDDGEDIERQWGRDDSKLVPLLVKEIQSLRLRLAALEIK